MTQSPATGEFSLQVLGKMIEHLGSQLYKHRGPALAELVANSWDAGANSVWIEIPEEGAVGEDNVIKVIDDGHGMGATDVQQKYLVIGRNKRTADGPISNQRRVMGRKGIGKLSGFGIADVMTVTTWVNDSTGVEFTMELSSLRKAPGTVEDVKFPWSTVPRPTSSPSGTMIKLSQLRHKTFLDPSVLRETLARRFSTTVRGLMKIYVNRVEISDPTIEFTYAYPSDGTHEEVNLPSGKAIKYKYKFSSTPLQTKEMQGFVVFANDRAAQAPPFFFDVESTASGQHSTRYVYGEIIADFVDEGIDDDTDNVSTDRQELDWDRPDLAELKTWGEELSRRVLRECADKKGQDLHDWIVEKPGFKERMTLLGPSVGAEVGKFLKILGRRSPTNDPRTEQLSDALIRAYEFRQFHDVVGEIDEIGDQPEKLEDLLSKLYDWKVLESRAILEIVKGRLSIIERLRNMVIQNRPETPSANINDNLHDLLAEYPWIFNPDWQVFAEEKSIGKQLHEWGVQEINEDMKAKRVDFLAFHRDEDVLVIIEIKRPGHPVELDELQRLQRYQNELGRAYPQCLAVLVHEGEINIGASALKSYENSDQFKLVRWSDLFKSASRFYSHYKGVLEGDVSDPSFIKKQTEVLRTRSIIAADSSHRGTLRSQGIGDTDT